ncbi:MAG: type I DNA topoisomerase [Candidatus Omnitrophota bacterium]
MADSLVIVESPAKAKTINKFIGDSYKIIASQGHLIDLPKSTIGVDIENDFKPQFVVIAGRRKILTLLKKEIKDKKNLYLATDPDREGEAIGYHIADKIGGGKNIFRVTFNEITKEAVQEAFSNPKSIDHNKVMAQHARRVLDRIVGYSLSPLLWKKVGMGLSAGRVQSVTVRLIVEKEEKIRAFTPQEYWELEAELSNKESKNFLARLEKYQGKKIQFKKKEEIDAVLCILEKENFVVADIKTTQRKKSPSSPFTTSKLQQDSFNKLGFSASKTMQIAQYLYEGIELNEEGPTGLISYMRTDSVHISKEAQDQAKKFILEHYGKEYYPETPNIYKSKQKSQEAHEAIRPTSVFRTSENIKQFLTPDQFKLYDLIWKRFVASQMTEALYRVTSVDIQAGDYIFRAVDTQEIFAGFNKVYTLEEEIEKGTLLPELSLHETLQLIRLIPSQHFTKPPARYNDASLVKALEEIGIGRPSTYAPTIQTIVTRNYVRRISGSLSPTELGIMVTKLLLEHFSKILDYEFTRKMEDELDEVELGKLSYIDVLKGFYSEFNDSFLKAVSEMKNMKKEQIPTDKKCPLCSAPMVIKWSRRGKFLSCSTFPACKGAESISTGIKCPRENCGGELFERRSKRGRVFFGCSNYPKCDFLANKLPTS